MVIASIMKRLNQLGHAMYKSLESLLVPAAKGQEYGQQLDIVTAFYKADFDQALVSIQPQNLGTWFADREPKKMGQPLFRVGGISPRPLAAGEVPFCEDC